MFDVSVIIPTYNRAKWLPETIDSILNQTFPPQEILVIDDGSSDNTEGICANYPDHVRYFRQQNAGVSAARNRGILEARGEWIAFADSDDPWEPHKLEIQCETLSKIPQAQWSITGCKVIDLKGLLVPAPRSWVRVFAIFKGGVVDPELHFSRWLENTEITISSIAHNIYFGDVFGMLFLGNIVLPSSVIVSAEILKSIGGFDESFRLAEETEFFHRLASIASVAIVMTPLVRYRIGQEISLVSSNNMVCLVENALLSVEKASELRVPLSVPESEAYYKGKIELLKRIAYIRLSNFDTLGARVAIRKAHEFNRELCFKTFGIFIATFIPKIVLRCFSVVKSYLR